jgi:TPP-dependent pyruvate/acetoin dehydrogenase alpha subunit
MEHVGPGEDFFTGYREESEVDEWKALDPIFEYEASSPMVVQAIRNEIEKAVIFATESPFPTIEELLTDVL